MRVERDLTIDEITERLAISRQTIYSAFRDFICMYIGEGYKRNRNRVSLGNSDPYVVRLAAHFIRRFSRNRVSY